MTPPPLTFWGLTRADWTVVGLLSVAILLIPYGGAVGNAVGRLIDRIKTRLGFPPHPLTALTSGTMPAARPADRPPAPEPREPSP